MKKFDLAYSLATENHGILTSMDARKNGITSKELARWVKNGRFIKAGRGVYRATMYPTSEEDPYAIAVAEAGEGACLYGESVIGMLRLMPVNVNFFHLAIPRRLRRRLPKEYIVSDSSTGIRTVNIRGVNCQKPVDAIRSCIGSHMTERLEAAAREAYRTGQMDNDEMEEILKELQNA